MRSLDDVRRGDDWKKWRALSANAPPFLAPEFFRLTQPLAVGTPLVAEAWNGDALVGALPLSLAGHKLSALKSDHSPGYDYWGDPEGLEAIWQALATDRRWDVLTLDGVPSTSPLATRFRAVVEAHGAHLVVKPKAHHIVLDLPGFERAVSAKFLANLRRCARKLGGIELERIASPTRSDFKDALAIEAAAWKGAAGESINSDARVTHLYQALTRVFGPRGKASLAFLRAKGERIAQLLSVEDEGSLYALKIGYDPKHADVSPGHLMVWTVAADAEKRGLRRFDFVGHDDSWKHKWTDAFEETVTVVVYRRSPRGLAEHAIHEVVGPRVPKDILRAPLRHGCQRTDLLGAHTLVERARDRLANGLGIKSGIKAALRGKTKAKPILGAESRFAVGAWVRVLDEEKLRGTLDAKDSLRGLKFVPTQAVACGRVYRVQQHVRRMLDDRGRMRPIAGTVLLEGVTCAGDGPEPAGCGRHCPLMFRDEWLEPAEAPHREQPAIHGRHARVRELDQIRATLDLQGRREGLTFMPEMEAFANQRFRVVGRLPKVYELDRWVEPRGAIYLLAGLHCTGAATSARGPCHRACALLWHEDWLVLDPEPST
ncbi:MAG: GNAT family N-acetyltransferase [Polyangiales bacterium]